MPRPSYAKGKERLLMGHRYVAGGVALAVGLALIQLGTVPVASQSSAPTTAWGEPDLQGIWTDEYQTPLQRPPQYADREFFTDEDRARLDKLRLALLGRDQRGELGTEEDVAGAYNALFSIRRPTGPRTSLIVDPPNGRVPPATPAVQKRSAEIRAFQLALIQATTTCKDELAECRGGTYGPPSPKRDGLFPYYNMTSFSSPFMNRHDNPEDGTMGERCMSSVMPAIGGYKRIVQSPGTVSIYIDVGQGQGWPRIIPVDGSPHLPAHIRRWWGDSRGHWEGQTLVVDVTNFSPKTDFGGSRENLHLVERWTRLDANTLEYQVTMDDATTWTQPWTIKQELGKQDDQANRIYYEPRCHEGNYGMVGQLTGARADEKAFAEGRGPHPAVRDSSGRGVGTDDNQDPLTCSPGGSRCDAGDPETFKEGSSKP